MSRDVEFDPGTSPCPPGQYRSTVRLAIDARALDILGQVMDAGGEGTIILGGYKLIAGKVGARSDD